MDPVIISLIVFGSLAYVGGAVFCYCRVLRRDPQLNPLLDVSHPLDPSLRPLDSSRVSDTVDYSDIYPQTN
jgi:hypothetical protein